MREPVSFFIPGLAKPAGSKRAFCLKRNGAFTGRAVVTDDCKTSRGWKDHVSNQARKHLAANFSGFEVFNTPVKFEVCFFMPRPKGHYRRSGALSKAGEDKPFPTVKPDALKLTRAVEDALTGIVYKDDALIVTEHIQKRYAERGFGVFVRVSQEVAA